MDFFFYAWNFLKIVNPKSPECITIFPFGVFPLFLSQTQNGVFTSLHPPKTPGAREPQMALAEVGPRATTPHRVTHRIPEESPIGYNNSGYNTNNSDYIWLYDGIKQNLSAPSTAPSWLPPNLWRIPGPPKMGPGRENGVDSSQEGHLIHHKAAVNL